MGMVNHRKKAYKILSPVEQKQLLNWLDKNRSCRDCLVILMMLRTGLSSTEVRELRLSDIRKESDIHSDVEIRAEIAHDRNHRFVPLGTDLRTRLKQQYRVRIEGVDSDWRRPTKARTFDYTFQSPGTYTVCVQAVDRDLNYSEVQTVNLTVQTDPKFAALQIELDALCREVGSKYEFQNIIGRSAAIKEVKSLMEKAIDSGLTVLITGETGTGKELVTRGIHYNSPRKEKPLRELNCGAMPKDLVASTLFGHRKGAFTGAVSDAECRYS